MLRVSTLLRAATLLVVGGALLGVLAAGGVYWYLVPKLPAIDVLKDVQLQVPLRVYTRFFRLVVSRASAGDMSSWASRTWMIAMLPVSASAACSARVNASSVSAT